jgi:hypothetical protein
VERVRSESSDQGRSESELNIYCEVDVVWLESVETKIMSSRLYHESPL